jgi:hypothetical protein
MLTGVNNLYSQAGALTQKVLYRLTRANPNEPTDIVGSPYFKDEYSRAQVYTALGLFDVSKMRYNIYEDAFEHEQGQVVYAIDPVEAIKKITMSENTFVVDDYEYKGKSRKGFFILLDSGNIRLYVKKTIEFKDRELPTATKYLGEPPRFIKGTDTYFYRMQTGVAQKFNGFDDILNRMPDRREELEQFIKKNKLTSRKLNDLKEFIRYCNLVTQ